MDPTVPITTAELIMAGAGIAACLFIIIRQHGETS